MSTPLPTFFKKAVDAAIAKLELGLNPKQTAELVENLSSNLPISENEKRKEALETVQDIILKKWNANQSYTTPFTDTNPELAEGLSDAHQYSKDQSENGKKAYVEAAVALGTVIHAALDSIRDHHEGIAAGVSLFHDTEKTPANDIDALQAETSRLLKLYAEKLGQEIAPAK